MICNTFFIFLVHTFDLFISPKSFFVTKRSSENWCLKRLSFVKWLKFTESEISLKVCEILRIRILPSN